MLEGKPVIRLGDRTTHGGVVVSASPNTSAHGKEVARMGDSVVCPIPGHGSCVIVEGDPTVTVDGSPIALQGHLTSCGASLISSLSRVAVSRGGDSSPLHPGSQHSVSTRTAQRTTLQQESTVESDKTFDLHFKIVSDKTGEPMANVGYQISLEDGTRVSGRTDENGLTEKIAASYAAVATIIAPYYDDDNSKNTDSFHGCDACCYIDS